MLWDDAVEVWRKSEVTKQFSANIEEALQDLMYKLIYAESQDEMLRLQGLIRAYRDIQDVVDNIEDLKPEKGE